MHGVVADPVREALEVLGPGGQAHEELRFGHRGVALGAEQPRLAEAGLGERAQHERRLDPAVELHQHRLGVGDVVVALVDAAPVGARSQRGAHRRR